MITNINSGIVNKERVLGFFVTGQNTEMVCRGCGLSNNGCKHEMYEKPAVLKARINLAEKEVIEAAKSPKNGDFKCGVRVEVISRI